MLLDVGILGAKLIKPDGTLFHAGIDFSMAKYPQSSSSSSQSSTASAGTRSWYSRKNANKDQDKKETKEEEKKPEQKVTKTPLPFYPLQGNYSHSNVITAHHNRHIGRNALDKRAETEKNVSALSSGMLHHLIMLIYCYIVICLLIQVLTTSATACILFSREVYHEVEGFNENLSESFAAADFSLRVSNRTHKRILYAPSLRAVYFGEPEKFDDESDVKEFHRVWGAQLEQKLTGKPNTSYYIV